MRQRIAVEEQDVQRRSAPVETVQADNLWQAPSPITANPRALKPTQILHLQQRYGNHAVRRMLARYHPKVANGLIVRRQEDEEYSSEEAPQYSAEPTDEGNYTPAGEEPGYSEEPSGEGDDTPEGEEPAYSSE